jgi:hypothetical protein
VIPAFPRVDNESQHQGSHTTYILFNTNILDMDASAFEKHCSDDLGITITVPKGMKVEEIADSLDQPNLWTEVATLLNITGANETRIKMKLNSALVRKRAADEQRLSSPKGKKPKKSALTPGGATWADGLRAKSPTASKTHPATSTNFLLDSAEKAKEAKTFWKITVVRPDQRIGLNSFWHWNAANIELIKGWLDCTGKGDFKGSGDSAAWEFRLSSSMVTRLNAMRIDVSPNSNSFTNFNKFMKLQRSGEAERDLKTKQLAGDPASFKAVTEVNEACYGHREHEADASTEAQRRRCKHYQVLGGHGLRRKWRLSRKRRRGHGEVARVDTGQGFDRARLRGCERGARG